MLTPIIHCRELSKTYYVHKKEPGLKGSVRSLFKREKRAKEAVKRVSFDVGEGEIVGTVGANGAGKPPWSKCSPGSFTPRPVRRRSSAIPPGSGTIACADRLP
jgi:ABC-2 type transport system ATP-binding protein